GETPERPTEVDVLPERVVRRARLLRIPLRLPRDRRDVERADEPLGRGEIAREVGWQPRDRQLGDALVEGLGLRAGHPVDEPGPDGRHRRLAVRDTKGTPT